MTSLNGSGKVNLRELEKGEGNVQPPIHILYPTCPGSADIPRSSLPQPEVQGLHLHPWCVTSFPGETADQWQNHRSFLLRGCCSGVHVALQTHQQGFHFNAVGLESPEDKLRCKTEKIYYLSAEGSHLNSPRGPCTHCLLLGHAACFQTVTAFVLLRDLTSSLRC